MALLVGVHVCACVRVCVYWGKWEVGVRRRCHTEPSISRWLSVGYEALWHQQIGWEGRGSKEPSSSAVDSLWILYLWQSPSTCDVTAQYRDAGLYRSCGHKSHSFGRNKDPWGTQPLSPSPIHNNCSEPVASSGSTPWGTSERMKQYRPRESDGGVYSSCGGFCC